MTAKRARPHRTTRTGCMLIGSKNEWSEQTRQGSVYGTSIMCSWSRKT